MHFMDFSIPESSCLQDEYSIFAHYTGMMMTQRLYSSLDSVENSLTSVDHRGHEALPLHIRPGTLAAAEPS